MSSCANEKEYKNIKCSLRSILAKFDDEDEINEDGIPGHIFGALLAPAIEKRCLAVSRMAARASRFCQLMVESLLEREDSAAE